MKGIATTYRGVRYRSLLEARWAAFFSLLGISFCYEPFETPGYIPDFLLAGRVLCEVRPFAWTVADDGPIVEARGEVAAAAALHGYGAAPLGLDLDCCEVGPWDRRIHPEWTLGAGDLIPIFAGVRGTATARELGEHRFERLWARASSRVQWKPNRRSGNRVQWRRP